MIFNYNRYASNFEMNPVKRIITSLFVYSLFYLTTVGAATTSSVDKIKVAYIYQFTQFVTWPDAKKLENQPFLICVLGDESIRKELLPLNQRYFGKRLIRVHYPDTLSKVDECSILYIAKSERGRLKNILNYLHDKSILTVSSIPDFAKQGGMIDFVIRNNKVRLQSNISVAKYANLSISAKLLEVCLHVFKKKNSRNNG